MNLKRFIHSISLFLIPSAIKRADYIRKHKLFDRIGENCSIMQRKLPLYSNLIRLGNNVHLASNVGFLTHDIIHVMLNNKSTKDGLGDILKEKIGCIEIQDNVFVGAGSRILYDTKIGSNVIIAAGSVVTHDIPSNSVAAGVPAKVIGTFDAFVKKRLKEKIYNQNGPTKERVDKNLVDFLWEDFDKRHSD